MIGFTHVNLAQFTRSISFGHILKDFFLLLELVTKDIFYHTKGMKSQNGRRSVALSWEVSGHLRCKWVKQLQRSLEKNQLGLQQDFNP